MIRRLILLAAALFMAAGLSGISVVAASASPPPPPVTNHCPYWANPLLHKPPLFCYANLLPGTTWTPPE